MQRTNEWKSLTRMIITAVSAPQFLFKTDWIGFDWNRVFVCELWIVCFIVLCGGLMGLSGGDVGVTAIAAHFKSFAHFFSCSCHLIFIIIILVFHLLYNRASSPSLWFHNREIFGLRKLHSNESYNSFFFLAVHPKIIPKFLYKYLFPFKIVTTLFLPFFSFSLIFAHPQHLMALYTFTLTSLNKFCITNFI